MIFKNNISWGMGVHYFMKGFFIFYFFAKQQKIFEKYFIFIVEC
jgi:hypothetical protein